MRLLTIILALLPLVFAGCERAQPRQANVDPVTSAPVLLVGMDGFEWDVLLPLLREGKMPVTASLMRRGTFGLLRTFQPTLSPVVWTSIATGKSPARHGITDFVKPERDAAGRLQLFTNCDRKTKAIWNILSDYDKRVAIIGWWMTYPAEPVNGVMVAQTNTTTQADVAGGKQVWKGQLVKGLSGQVYPPQRQNDIIATLTQVDKALPSLTDEIFGQFRYPLSPLGKRLWSNCAWSFRADATYLAVTKQLLSDPQHFDFAAVYFGGPDVVGHRFWRYMRPNIYEHQPSPEAIANFHDIVEDYYVYMDRALGQLLDEAGPNCRVIVISDHGMQPINLRASFDPDDPPNDVNSAHHLNAPPGVIIAAGPGIARTRMPGPLSDLSREQLTREATVLDVTPTVLTLMGIPVGEDMDGRVAYALIAPGFRAAHETTTVPSHDTSDWQRSHESLTGGEGPDAERVAQLEALGYIVDVETAPSTASDVSRPAP